jgi:hypothetical protein
MENLLPDSFGMLGRKGFIFRKNLLKSQAGERFGGYF